MSRIERELIASNRKKISKKQYDAWLRANTDKLKGFGKIECKELYKLYNSREWSIDAAIERYRTWIITGDWRAYSCRLYEIFTITLISLISIALFTIFSA